MRTNTLKTPKVTAGCQIDPSLSERMDRVIRYNNQKFPTHPWKRNTFLIEMIQEYVETLEKDIPVEFELLPLKNS